MGLAFGLEIVNCTVRDTVVVNLDNHAGVAAVRRSARSGRSSSRESRKGQEGRNPARVSVNSEQSSVAGGVVGAAVESFLAGCHNFGFTQNPLSPIVTTSNYKSYQKSGVDYAGGEERRGGKRGERSVEESREEKGKERKEKRISPKSPPA